MFGFLLAFLNSLDLSPVDKLRVQIKINRTFRLEYSSKHHIAVISEKL